MKKITLLTFLLFITFSISAQVLNEPANWPNSNWTITTVNGYTASSLLNDPTASSSFTFDDDAAGSSSDDDLAAESPVIDLTAALGAGENQLLFTGTYMHRDIGGSLSLDYWDADSATWVELYQFEGTTSPNTYDACDNMFPFEAGLVIAGFTPTQLSGFKYRLAYDDNDGWQWGWCIQQPTVISAMGTAPNCDLTMTAPTDGESNVAIDAPFSWTAATGYPEGYYVSIGTTPGGTDILDNFDNGPSLSYDPTGVIDYSTTYYVTITPYNGVGTATGCTSTQFSTETSLDSTVICANGPLMTTFCYTNNDTTLYTFTSDDGSQLVVSFASGSTENNFDELVVYDSDGTTNLNTASPYGNAGDLTGLVFTSTGNSISVGVTSDGSVISCTNDPWVFYVECLDPNALPNCNASLTAPVDGATNVNENIDLVWSPATVFVTGYQISIGTTPGGTDIANAVDVGDTLTYDPGTLTSSTTYYVTIVPYNDNGMATGCIEESFTVRTIPNPPNGVTCSSGTSSFVFVEDFETDPPNGWTGNSFDGSNGNWDITAGNANSTGTGPSASYSGGMHLEYEASGDATNIASAISPAIDLTPATDSAELSFYMHAYGADMGTLNVGVGTSATGPFTNVFSWGGEYQTSDTEAWLPVGIDISAYLGQTIYLEFSYGGAGTGWEGDMSIDLVRVETCGNFCIAPSNLQVANITSDTADISWDANNGETAWEIVIQPAGTGEPTGSGTATSTNNPYPATSLTPSTDYEVYVRADCGGNGFSIWTGPVNFTTLNAPPPPPNGVTCSSGSSTFVFTEDFETDPPSGWTGTGFDGSNGNWDITVGNANSTGTGPSASYSGSMHLEYEASGNAMDIASAVSPAIDLTTAVDGAELTFYLHAYGADMGTLNVGVGTSPTGPFTTEFTWTGDYQTSDTDPWVPVGVNIDAYMGNVVYVEFSYGAAGTGWEGDISIDYVRVEACGTFCIAPTNLQANNITGTTADISWDALNGETAWEYVVQPAGTGEPTGNGNSVTSTSLTETGLDYDTDYELYVRTDCGADGYSIWAGPIYFTTAIQTDFIVDCDAGSINTTYCYENNDPNQFTFTSSTGYPLTVMFNAGQVENNWDELIVLDSDGTTNLNTATPYGAGGDLTGLTFTSTGDTMTIYVQSDGSVNCQGNNYTSMDFDVWCQTCIMQTVSYSVNGVCDPSYEFTVDVDVSDFGDAASITVSDDQGGTDQVITAPGVVTMGPYPTTSEVILTVANTDDVNCILTSDLFSFACPPPPNDCSIIYAGADDSVSCEDPSTDLTATFMTAGVDPNTYDINALGSCPTPPITGGTPTGLVIDDRWSDVIDLGFEFCFFGNTYTQLVIGANGLVSFDITQANAYCPWAFSASVPSPSLPLNSIYGAYHDINPATCGDIEYFILGAAPNRQFVVNFVSTCQFSCTTLQTTQQIILYESSNNIDVNIFDKPLCSTWNSGNAVIGVQNIDGTVGFTPPGRNTGAWAATNEFWRFSNAGDPNYTFEWLDGTTPIGTTETITVSPEETTTYTAAVSYTQCDGSIKTVTDDVVVEFIGAQINLAQPGDLNLCVDSTEPYADFDLTLQDEIIINDQTNLGITYYESYEDADAMVNEIANPSAYTNLSTPQTVYARATDVEFAACYEITSFNLIVTPKPFYTTSECVNQEYHLTIEPEGNSFDVSQSTFTLYDDMGSELYSNGLGDNIFVITESDFNEPMSGSTYNFIVEVGDASGCTIVKELLIENISCIFPQGISPNGDGFNDRFDLSNYEVSKIEIYNRNGTLVYSKDNYTDDWYGKKNDGQELPVGTYFYVIKYQGGKEKTAWVYINKK